MENIQKEFCSQYSEMLHDRKKLSKDCLIQEIKLAKLSGGIESLEKLANRDHLPSKVNATPSKSHGKLSKQWEIPQTSNEDNSE